MTVMTVKEASERRSEWYGKANIFRNVMRPAKAYTDIRPPGKNGRIFHLVGRAENRPGVVIVRIEGHDTIIVEPIDPAANDAQD